MYWYRLENAPSNLPEAAYKECASNTNSDSWYMYFNLLFYSEKLQMNLSHYKTLCENN